jgi:hypothetical protein
MNDAYGKDLRLSFVRPNRGTMQRLFESGSMAACIAMMFLTRLKWARVSRLMAVLTLSAAAWAQIPVPASSQFDITGFIQSATLGGPAAGPGVGAHQGGSITVNGHVIIVPSETIVILPANALTWQELFAFAPAPYTGVATGMALSDVPAPMTTYEAQVVGNRVLGGPAGADLYIAGLIYISQHALNTGSGFINCINYTTGEMLVGGVLGNCATGTRVQINDPVITTAGDVALGTGRYSRGQTPDARFQVDQDNPTIASATGFPMCMPRVVADPNLAGNPDDARCPITQRPLVGNPVVACANPTTPGAPCTNFTTLPPGGGAPSPSIQAPFEVGDWITFAGTLVQDCAMTGCPGGGPTAGPWPAVGVGATYISAHTISNNTAIYTFPGTDPSYVATEVTIIGTGGLTVIGAGEAVIRTRFEGMTSDVDPTGVAQRIIHLYGIDFNAITGATSDRDFGTISVDPGPPNGAVKGRWRFRPPCLAFGSVPAKPDKDCVMNAAGSFLPPPREMRAVIQGAFTAPITAASPRSANGIVYGQYHAPILEYIFPENVPGAPIPENNFNTMPFLAQGGYTSSGGTLVGQLNPWPSNIVPTPACGPAAANAGGPYVVGSGGTIALAGSASGTAPITFAWTAVSGTFDNAAIANPNYTAPQVAVSTSVNLTLTATNCGGPSTATTTVTVAAAAPPTVNPIANQAVDSGSGGSFAVTASDPNVPAAVPLTWSVSQTGTPALLNLVINSSGNTTATVSYTAPAGVLVSTPITVTVTATNAAGVASAPVSTTVTINPAVACNAPVANAGGPYTVASGGSITLNGSATGSTPLTFLWAAPAAGDGTINPLNDATPTYTAPVTGVAKDVTVSVTASNACAGSPSTATATVHVNAALAPTVNPVAAISVPVNTVNVSMLVTGSDPTGLTPLTFTVTQAPVGTLLFPTNGCAGGVTQGNLCVTPTGPTQAAISFNAPATPGVVTLTIRAINSAGVLSAPVTTTVTLTDVFNITAAEYRIGKQRLIVNVTELTLDPTILIFLNPYRCEINAAPCVQTAPGVWMYDPDPANGGVGNLFTGGAGGLYIVDVVGAPKPACNLGGLYQTPCGNVSISARSSKGGTATSALTRIRQ